MAENGINRKTPRKCKYQTGPAGASHVHSTNFGELVPGISPALGMRNKGRGPLPQVPPEYS